jgi:uncharacterized protein (DUF2225 family)
MITDFSIVDYIPGETFFSNALQSTIIFQLGKKQIKKGRLLLFKRAHFHIIFTMLNGRDNKENFEIPIPFKTEHHLEDGIIYFDYRISSLAGNNKETEERLNAIRIRGINPTQYYNNILEISLK